MSKTLKIDFVSDVVCPWCVIGLRGLEIALERIGDAVEADITVHPYELNPDMPVGGESLLEHIAGKYGIPPDQVRQNGEQIRARAADVGFMMNRSEASRIYNTFDAHRLLAWAKAKGAQLPLKRALLAAYFTDQADPGDPEVLVAAAEKVGLDGREARDVLASNRFADQVRSEEALWVRRGIRGVPAVVVNDRYLISGGQSPEAFERQLRAIAAEQAGDYPG